VLENLAHQKIEHILHEHDTSHKTGLYMAFKAECNSSHDVY